MARYFGIDTPINSLKVSRQFKALATSLLPTQILEITTKLLWSLERDNASPKSQLYDCPLICVCKAYATGRLNSLPVKLKKTKVTKKYFNFLVMNSEDQKTVLEQRTEKGIWQQLYQFPLIETAQMSKNEF